MWPCRQTASAGEPRDTLQALARRSSHGCPTSRKGVPPALRKPPIAVLAASLALLLASAPAFAGVFLSELCDPQNNFQNDRFIEIYNSGPGAVDLTGWSVVAIANGVDVTTWPLSGTLPAGQARVCGTDVPLTAFTVDFQNHQWFTTGYFNWNGKVGDGAKLIDNSSAIVDLVVATGILFENADLVRIASVSVPNPVYTPGEWMSTPVLLATNASPGTHNGSAPPLNGPRLSNIVTDPAIPLEGVPTDVQAAVVDPSGPLTSVTLSWGSSAASLPNSIPMSLLADSTFRTASPLPALTAGASAFYRIAAVGALATTLSSVRSYMIAGGGGGLGVPPTVLSVGETSDSTLLVFFSEPVEPVTSQTSGHYAVGALVAVAAVRDPVNTSQVSITVRGLTPGGLSLTVNNVADLNGDVAFGATRAFTYIDVSIPPGYYDSALGLTGAALRVALHNIIKAHTVNSYAFALTAFGTTDLKPNSKIWDMYSDIPGGTPPYEYAFGGTGQGATEGLGYNREHSFPQSWFNSASPMVSDLWILYPTDSKVNGYRANFAYGNVGSASTTSLNGSKLGSSASPGYAGTVFEPIDAYKGDLARGQMYVATRYFNEDATWPGGPSTSRSQLLPWAVQQYLAWSNADPVGWKERLRNGAVYVYQHNRNPFVDHPEFVTAMYDTAAVTGVDGGPGVLRGVALYQNSPNPFVGRTAIGFELRRDAAVSLAVYDLSGRLVRMLASRQTMAPGHHQMDWDGRDESGALAQAGLYFYRLDAGGFSDMRRMVRMK